MERQTLCWAGDIEVDKPHCIVHYCLHHTFACITSPKPYFKIGLAKNTNFDFVNVKVEA